MTLHTCPFAVLVSILMMTVFSAVGVGEWETLCAYLWMPSNLLQLYYNNQELMETLLQG